MTRKLALLYCEDCGLGFRHFKNKEEAWEALKVHREKVHGTFKLW